VGVGGLFQGELGELAEVIGGSAADGGTGEAFLEGGVGEGDQVGQCLVGPLRMRLAVGIAGGSGVLIEGAGVLAGIAAEESRGQESGDVGWGELFGFGGPVGEAASGVETTRAGQCGCGAGVEATGALAAVVGCGLIRFEGQVGDNLAEEQVGAEGGV